MVQFILDIPFRVVKIEMEFSNSQMVPNGNAEMQLLLAKMHFIDRGFPRDFIFAL